LNKVSERVLDMVRRELVRDPAVDNAVLYERAKALDPAAMEGVDRRQFNARYPLQVKRRELTPSGARIRKEPPRRRRAKRPAPAGPGGAAVAAAQPVFRQMAREAVRDVLLRFAQDLADAESRGQLVRVVAAVDVYAEQILALGLPAE
jgi:hypothetical protein